MLIGPLVKDGWELFKTDQSGSFFLLQRAPEDEDLGEMRLARSRWEEGMERGWWVEVGGAPGREDEASGPLSDSANNNKNAEA